MGQIAELVKDYQRVRRCPRRFVNGGIDEEDGGNSGNGEGILSFGCSHLKACLSRLFAKL